MKSKEEEGKGKAGEGQKRAGWRPGGGRKKSGPRPEGSRQEGGPSLAPGQEEPRLRPGYRIPRRGQSWRTAEATGGLPLSYEGYIVTAPRDLGESRVFQDLVKRGMLFRAPQEGPGEYRGPHFRFTPGRAAPDRRRGRSPGWQEAAKKRHRD